MQYSIKKFEVFFVQVTVYHRLQSYNCYNIYILQNKVIFVLNIVLLCLKSFPPTNFLHETKSLDQTVEKYLFIFCNAEHDFAKTLVICFHSESVFLFVYAVTDANQSTVLDSLYKYNVSFSRDQYRPHTLHTLVQLQHGSLFSNMSQVN